MRLYLSQPCLPHPLLITQVKKKRAEGPEDQSLGNSGLSQQMWMVCQFLPEIFVEAVHRQEVDVR